jgi:hypothetical protein
VALDDLYRQRLLDGQITADGMRMALRSDADDRLLVEIGQGQPQDSALPAFDPMLDARPLARWQDLCRRVTYRPGWTVTAAAAGYGQVLLTVLAQVDDVRAYQPGTRWFGMRMIGQRIPKVTVGATTLAPLDLSERDMLEEIRRTLLLLERHETDEWLMVDGRQPFDPHAKDQEGGSGG